MLKTRITVNVTQKHIANGQRNKCSQCPVALAVAERLHLPIPDSRWDNRLGVTDKYVFFYKESIQSDLPVKAMQFVCNFDDRKPVAPFSFWLNVPECLVPVENKL